MHRRTYETFQTKFGNYGTEFTRKDLHKADFSYPTIKSLIQNLKESGVISVKLSDRDVPIYTVIDEEILAYLCKP